MTTRNYASAVFLLMLITVTQAASTHRADDILREPRLKGHVVSVEGFVRFDRVSQRGFLYRDLTDMQRRNYRNTIFLELGNEGFASLKIPDGSYVIATGYLSKDLRGPLGVYPAHIIVDRVKVIRKNMAVRTHSGQRVPSNQTMERTPTRCASASCVAKTFSLRATLALGGRRSSCSR